MKKVYKISLIFFACIVLSFACTKVELGYLSDYIKFTSPSLVVNKGTFSTTDPVFTDGSTLPLEVELLEIRNSETGAVATELLELHEMNMWKAPYMYREDTTLELVMKKIELKAVPAFELNTTSGQLRFNPNTYYAEGSNYEFDLKISNVRGSKEYPGIGKIEMIDVPEVQWQGGFGIGVRPVNLKLARLYSLYETPEDQYNGTSEILEVKKISEESSPGITLHLKVVDRNGTPFPPEAITDGWFPYANSGNPPVGYGNNGSSVKTEKTATGWKYYFPTTPFPFYNSYNNNSWYVYHSMYPEYIGEIDPTVPVYGVVPDPANYFPDETYWAYFRFRMKIHRPGTWEATVKFPMLTVADTKK